MNRIQKIVYTMACLLTATGALADGYKIRLNAPSNGTMTSSVTEASTGTTVTLTVNPTGDYYLSALYYEKIVTDMGGAESPRRRSPSFSEKEQIPIKTTNQSNRNNHYGGTYEISMPPYDIEVTAIFSPCTSIAEATLHWDASSLSTSITYDGSEHTANVYLGSSDLELNANYTIDTNKLTNVGGITPTITGVGTYCGTINDHTISITQKPLTITAQAQTITYGSSIQTGISYVNVSGLVTNDALTSITLTPSTSQVTTTGTITPSGATTTKGISNYAVTYNTGALTINPKDLSAMVTVTLNEEYHNYDGSQHQPSIDNTDGSNMKVYYGNTRLTQGSDFTTSYTATNGVYTNNIDYITPDIYTVTITYNGNYTGTKTVDYQIRPQLNLTDQAARWMTYYEATYNMEVIDGFEAYTIREVTASSVTLEQRDFIRANNTPMLLYRSGDAKQFNLPLLKPTDSRVTNSQNATNGWKLSDEYKICTSNMDLPGDIPSGKEIWILVDDHFMRTKSGTLLTGRCYIERSNSSYTSPMLSIGRKTTGIEEETIKDFDLNGVWYTLDGRKIQGIPAQKGIYINNGKKIIIK